MLPLQWGIVIQTHLSGYKCFINRYFIYFAKGQDTRLDELFFHTVCQFTY